MTIIQPNKNKNFLIRILAIFSLPLVAAMTWLVFIYNQAVGLEHGLDAMQSKILQLESKNAELKEQSLSLLSSQNLESIAIARELVKERKPQYLEVSGPWAFASQY